MQDLPYDVDRALAHLASSDAALGRVVRAVGPYTAGYEPVVSPFESLCETIAYQQLSGKAAATIYGRFRALTDRDAALNPVDVLALPDSAIRGAGMSAAKTVAIKDLAQKTVDGIVPDLEHLEPLPDEEVIDRLTQVKGIGPWSVKMFLMRRLGRPDVFAHDDLGIRKGVQKIYDLPELPSPKEVLHMSETWKPYRTLASWYLWRCLDLEEEDWISAS